MEKKIAIKRIVKEVKFTYDLAEPISRRGKGTTTWHIIEIGKKKEHEAYRYYFCVDRIRSALSDIRKHIRKTKIFTPCIGPVKHEEGSNVPVIYSKQEYDQIRDSVQARGVIYTLLRLSDEEKRNGVIAISTGHFAQTLCYFGKTFGIPVTVVMPSSTAQETANECRDLLATVIVQGDNMIDVHRIAMCIARTRGLVYLDGNYHPNMIIGQATLGIEIFEQMTEQDFDVLILPTMIDGCGITAGIAIAVRESNPNIKIIEVQTDLQHSLIDVSKVATQLTGLDIMMKHSIAYEWLDTIQKKLFDFTISVNIADVQKEVSQFKDIMDDYHKAIATVAIRSSLLKDFIRGKRVLIPYFGKTDFSMSFASNEPSLETRAGPSTSSS